MSNNVSKLFVFFSEREEVLFVNALIFLSQA